MQDEGTMSKTEKEPMAENAFKLLGEMYKPSPKKEAKK